MDCSPRVVVDSCSDIYSSADLGIIYGWIDMTTWRLYELKFSIVGTHAIAYQLHKSNRQPLLVETAHINSVRLLQRLPQPHRFALDDALP